MAPAASNTSSFNLRSILEKEKLSGTNFIDWYRNLRIVLKQEKKEYVLEVPYPDEPADNAPAADRRAYEKHTNDSLDVSCLMLACMSSELQKQYENRDAHDMIVGLRGMFENQARAERYNTSKSLFACRLTEGSPVSPHVIKMIGYIESLEKLGFPLSPELATDVILQSLPASFEPFILNFHMNSMEKSMAELHGMLKTAEESIKKSSSHVMMVQKDSKKRKRKGKAKTSDEISSSKPKPVGKPKASPAASDTCHHCHKTGHWRRNCKLYLEELKRKKGSKTSSSGINVIEINLATRPDDSWVFDTGSMIHTCKSLQGLKRTRKCARGELDARVGNGAKVAALAVGVYSLSLPSGLVLELNNCYYIPALGKNIISSSCLEEDGYEFIIKNKCCSIFLNGMLYGNCPLVNGLYILDLEDITIYNIDTKKPRLNDLNPTFVWHCRLGHINEKRMQKLHKDGLLHSFDFESFDTCESCLLGKMTKTPFTGRSERTNELLALVHTDVCGPMSSTARGGFQYFITFTDDFSRYGYIYLMRHKSESFEKFKEFQNEVQNHIGKTIKFLRSDRGGEYLSHEFGDHLRQCGIVPQLTPPGTPQWNGVSERRNRTLLDMVRSMMSQSDLPLSFWGYALETAAFTLNRVPSKAVERTPYEIWTGKRPGLSFLKIWGCEAYVKRLSSDKLTPKSDKCFFVGYPRETKGYYFYNREEGKVFVARNGVFLEKEFLAKRVSGSTVQLEEIREPLESVSAPIEPQLGMQDVAEPVVETPAPRRSERFSRAPERFMFLTTGQRDILLLDNDEPKTYSEAMVGPDSEKWLGAMRSELESMRENQVWNLVDPPDGVKTIECKWVFKKKIDVDGNVHIYKARLVAKGFRQIQGVDYDETFSPVAMLKSIRILLAIAAYFDYEIWQMDVKTAFLNGNLSEDVYMTQPEGFVNPKNAGKICKLQKSIYGLKQASRSWNLRFDEVIKGFGFIKNEEEPCVYKRTSGSALVFLVLYVDDILLIGNNIPMLDAVKSSLKKSFSMKDLGEAAYILGIKIYRDRSKRLIGLSQSTYIDKVLNRFNMQDSKKGFLPMSHGITLSKNQCPKTSDELERMSAIPYASAIGSIMYAMFCTRPDVSYALSVTSRYQSNPGECHWAIVKSILKYMRRTKDMFLVYGGEEELVVNGYTDASFQTDKDDSRSQSGFVFCLNGGAVSWKSSKQETVADSTTEAEYIAASEAAKEAVWIRKFVSELGVVPSASSPMDLYCDNSGAIAQAKEPRSHQKSKHILRRYHLIREIIDRGDVKICKVHTDSNIADPLTKPLPQPKHEAHLSSMGIRYLRDRL
jgi:hypothetical protein